MSRLISILFFLVGKFGGLGLLAMGVLDSSFLFMPFGNDLLVVGLSARYPARMPYYAAMAAVGSMLGCLTVDWASRKGGAKGLEKIVPRGQLNFVTPHIRQSIGWSLAIASIMPPPFPFTPFVAAAAAFQYPRPKLLTIVAVARFFRFLIIGAAAVIAGPAILQVAYGPVVRYLVIFLAAVTVIGTIVTTYVRVRLRSAGSAIVEPAR
jgi:membrane protein YqaA with SNARE-associated domain